MRRRIVNPRQWVARLGEPMALEAELEQRWNRNFARQQNAQLHAIAFLMAAVLAWLVGDGMAAGLASAYVVPGLWLPAACATAAALALLLWFLTHKGIGGHLPGRVARLGWIVFLPLGFLFGAAALASQALAEAGPAMRAQVVHLDRDGRGFFRSTTSTLLLRDGSRARISGAAGRRTQCLQVRRLRGPWGFAWIRIEDASPPPGPGQLNWPIARADCFSDRPLATLRG